MNENYDHQARALASMLTSHYVPVFVPKTGFRVNRRTKKSGKPTKKGAKRRSGWRKSSKRKSHR